MVRNRTLKFILLASLALNLSLIGTAGYLWYKESGYWVSPLGVKMERDRFLFEELSLRPEQMKEMKARALLFRSEIEQMRKEIMWKRQDLIRLMRSDSPDVNAINAVTSEINGMQGEMQKKIALHILEEKSLLDKGQQKQFLDLIEKAMTQGRQPGCPPAAEQD